MYFETHINIKKIPKYCKKFCKKKLRICKKILHCFPFIEVLYDWVKFRRLKMGDPVYKLVTLKLKLKFIYELGHAFLPNLHE